jgi:hypothetical protein
MSLFPSQKKTFSQKEAKEAEKRLKDKATLKQFMEKFNSQGDEESRAQEAQLNITKLLEVKDWKKARYEINLAELEKIKKKSEQPEEVSQETDEISASSTSVPSEEKPTTENIKENDSNIDSNESTEEVYNEHLEKRLLKEKIRAEKKNQK